MYIYMHIGSKIYKIYKIYTLCKNINDGFLICIIRMLFNTSGWLHKKEQLQTLFWRSRTTRRWPLYPERRAKWPQHWFKGCTSEPLASSVKFNIGVKFAALPSRGPGRCIFDTPCSKRDYGSVYDNYDYKLFNN